MESFAFETEILGNTLRAYIFCGVILVAGLLFKGLISRVLNHVLYRLLKGFHAGTDPAMFISLLLRPVEIMILLAVLYAAINQLEYPFQEVIFRRIQNSGKTPVIYELRLITVVDKLFLLAFIMSFFHIVLRIIDYIALIFLTNAGEAAPKSEHQLIPFVKELSKIITVIIGIFVILGSVFELNVATIIAGLGIGGIAVALAAQDTLQNLLGSFTIFADKPFVVGDTVKTDKYEGIIEKVGFRSTLLRTNEKTLVVIPNKKMVDSPLENLSRRDAHRIRFTLTLSHNTGSKKVQDIMAEIRSAIKNEKGTGPDILVTFETISDTGLIIVVQYYASAKPGTDVGALRESINTRIMEIIENYDAVIASPLPIPLAGFNAKPEAD